MAIVNYVVSNWPSIQAVIVAILAVDAALIPIFPNAGLLVTIKNLLSKA